MKTVTSILFAVLFLFSFGHTEAAIAGELWQINQRPIEKIRLDLWYFGVKTKEKDSHKKTKKKREKLPEELSVPLKRYFSTSL